MTEPITCVTDDLARAHDQLGIDPDDARVGERIAEARDLIEGAIRKIQSIRCNAVESFDKL